MHIEHNKSIYKKLREATRLRFQHHTVAIGNKVTENANDESVRACITV